MPTQEQWRLQPLRLWHQDGVVQYPVAIYHTLAIETQRAELVLERHREAPYTGQHLRPLEPHGEVDDAARVPQPMDELPADLEGAHVAELVEEGVCGYQRTDHRGVEEPAEVLKRLLVVEQRGHQVAEDAAVFTKEASDACRMGKALKEVATPVVPDVRPQETQLHEVVQVPRHLGPILQDVVGGRRCVMAVGREGESEAS